MFDFLSFLFKNLMFSFGFVRKNFYPLPLSEEEENYYVLKLLNKDEKARNILIEHNLRLVLHIIKKYDYYESDDLFSIGSIGLIKAIDSYSKDKGVRIATYASRCIENEILMHLRKNKKRLKDVSLNEAIGVDKDGNDITLLDITPSITKAYESNNKIENIVKLRKYFQKLDEREKDILNKRFGLDGSKPLTQKEIAKSYNISRSYVSRIEKRAFIKIYQDFKKNT